MGDRRLAAVIGPVVALAALGLYLLAATQPWATAVVERSPGAPRSRVAVLPADALAWGPAAALVAALASTVSLTVRGRWRRWVLLAGVLGAATAAAAATRILLDPSVTVPEDVVAAATTPWAWVAGATASLACAALARSALAPTVDARPHSRTQDTSSSNAHEVARRSAARQWQDLTEGRDPTSEA